MTTEQAVVSYNLTNAAIQEMSEMYLPLVITDLDDKEQFDAVRSARLVVKGKRIEVDKRRKELKADALAWGKKVQTEANRIFALIEPIETHLKNEEGKAEAEKQRLEDERIAAVRAKLDYIENLSANQRIYFADVPTIQAMISEAADIEITPDVYFEFTAEAAEMLAKACLHLELALHDRVNRDREEAERKAENERLAVERNKQEIEAANLKELADKMAEVQRKLDEDRAIAEAALKADRDALEAEKRADQERKDQEEFERKTVERAKDEAIEKAKQDAIDKAYAEKEAAEEKERQESLKPDKEKLEALSDFLDDDVYNKFPDVESDAAQEILRNAAIGLGKVAGTMRRHAKEM